MTTSQRIEVWNSLDLPDSLASVGGEAVATHNHNVICFIDVNTKDELTYHVRPEVQGNGVLLIAGHTSLPVFAYAESTVRPVIRVVSYPGFKVISEFESPDVIEYTDLVFSRSEHLIAQTSYPNYIIRVLNYRLNLVLVELETNLTCTFNSILCSHSYLPTIAQFSKVNRKLVFYDLCYQAEGYQLVEVSDMLIEADQDYSVLDNKCFTDDHSFYMVNDFGDILAVDISLFSVSCQWFMPRIKRITKPRPYILQSAKRGLMVANNETIFFVKRKGNDWQEEFRILNVPNTISKLLSDGNGDVYVINSHSNIYVIDNIEGTGQLNLVVDDRFMVEDFVILQGLRQNLAVVLTTDNKLFAYKLNSMRILSKLPLDASNSLASHPTKCFIVVGTANNFVHFLSYEQPNDPQLLGSIDLESSAIRSMKIWQNCLVIRDVFEDMVIVNADFAHSTFSLSALFESPMTDMFVLDYFVIDVSHIMTLFSLEARHYDPYANHMIIYNWSPQREFVDAQKYQLPFNYSSFALSRAADEAMFQLFGVREHDVIIDVLTMSASGAFELSESIQIDHCSHIGAMSLNQHLLTSCVGRTYLSLGAVNRSKKSFVTTKLVDLKLVPSLPKRLEVSNSGKTLISLYADKCFQVQQLGAINSELKENIFLPVDEELNNIPLVEEAKYVLKLIDCSEKPKPTEAEIKKRAELLQRRDQLAVELSALIDYDIAILGTTQGVYAKFCLNLEWLERVSLEAQNLFSTERDSLQMAVEDQTRIRNWINQLIFSDTEKLSSTIRALFTNVSCQNYSNKKARDVVQKEYDLFRFHDMLPPDNELDELVRESIGENKPEQEEEEVGEVKPLKARRLYEVQGNSVYEHIMADEFNMQSTDEISYYEMHNTCTKFKLALNNPLRSEFNKIFDEAFSLKLQVMENIRSTNLALLKIYENMNIMRRLLFMDPLVPAELSVPHWMRDENLETILRVDDSEIKAVNRRKKKAQEEEIKSGRMLLWALEFWERALINMMDGVLEKLWEEEIKKDIPEPEFVTKKEPHEFSIAEQRQYREYLDKVRLLELDRRKYLRILEENDIKGHELKKKFILKINENITELAVLKLKYDFALKRCRLQLINTKTVHFKRIQYVKTLNMFRKDFGKITSAIVNMSRVCSYWEKSVADIKNRFEAASNRERSVERSFRSYFLNAIPSQFIPEMRRLYKKTPKINKSLISVMICDVIKKLIQKKSIPNFPLPKAVEEFVKITDDLDEPQHMPHQFETKHWEQFVKLRRQKVEHEFTVKGISLKLLEVQSTFNKHLKTQNILKNVRTSCQTHIDQTKKEYMGFLQNRSLVITLDLGQVEVNFSPSTIGYKDSVLLRVDDVNDVNNKIKTVGLQKLRAMQRVATFRRQVISKEWEHEVTKANISYLKYMLGVIEKSKVTMEFLSLLRNWDKLQAQKKFELSNHLIEKEIAKKITAAHFELNRYTEKIDNVREKITKIKHQNVGVNGKIDKLKIDYAFTAVHRDDVGEQKRIREQYERMQKIKAHRNMMETVRADYARILELKTILELQRLRTYPTLGAAPTKMQACEGSFCL